MTVLGMGSDEMLRREISRGVVLVEYGAPWCPPCRTLEPILEELDRELDERVRIVNVNCDELPDSAAEAGVMSMPTVILFKEGEPLEKLVGLRPKAVYRQLIEKHAPQRV